MELRAPRGTRDILPGEVEVWQHVESVARRTLERYGYREIRTPTFEQAEVFERGVGAVTDIVEKQTYTFTDRGDHRLTLRPEGTAPAVRAYLEHNLAAGPQPVKVYYIGPMFRYERPQAGRYRQFHQIGAETLGTLDPVADVEMIAMPAAIYQELGLQRVQVQLNSIGCPVCRPAYHERLREYLAERAAGLCRNCRQRAARSPLRVLDCKEEACRQATR